MTSVLLLQSSCEWRQAATRWHHLLTSYNQLSPTGELKFWIKEFSLPFPIYSFFFFNHYFVFLCAKQCISNFSWCEPIVTREPRLDFCRIKPLFLIFPHRLNSKFSPVTSSYITCHLKTVTFDCLNERALETKSKKTCFFFFKAHSFQNSCIHIKLQLDKTSPVFISVPVFSKLAVVFWFGSYNLRFISMLHVTDGPPCATALVAQWLQEKWICPSVDALSTRSQPPSLYGLTTKKSFHVSRLKFIVACPANHSFWRHKRG